MIDGTNVAGDIVLGHTKGEVELQDVSFRYLSRPEVLVLDQLSLRIPAHKMTAIVGLSGSGKSTITSLITRLYDPFVGRVLVDGYDVRYINAQCLRSNIACVQQDPALLDTSILENVAYGLSSSGAQSMGVRFSEEALRETAERIRTGVPMESAVGGSRVLQEVVRGVDDALAQSGASDFVDRLEHGIATRVGPGGRQLSGGQRQRIAFARALIRDAPIIILDEATAALDSYNEQLIQETLEKKCKGRTIVFVAHRLSTIKNADNIVVMKAGKVVEQGSYAELLRKNGEFCSMVQLQALKSNDSTAVTQDKASSAATSPLEASAEDITNEKVDSEEESLPLLGRKEEARETVHKHRFLSIFAQVLRLSRRQRLYIALGVASAFAVGISHSVEGLLFGGTVGDVNTCNEESYIRHKGLAYAQLFLFFGVIELFANVTSSSSFGWVSENLLFKTRVLSFRALLRQNVEWHESSGRTPNTLMSYIGTDAASLSSMTGNVLGISFGVLVSLVSGIIVSHIVAWRIAIVLLALVPLLLASGFFRLKVLAKFQENHRQAFSDSVSVAKEAVDAISTVAVYGLETVSLESYRRALRAPYEATVKTVAYGNLWLAAAFSMSNVIYGVAYWWGSRQIAAGNYTQGQFFVVLPALLVGAQGCGQLFSMAPDISRAGIAAIRVLDLISLSPGSEPTEPTFTDKDEKVVHDDIEAGWQHDLRGSPPNVSGGISVSLRNVYFSYPSRPNVLVLRSLDLDIPSNKFCALVGRSGSGKSTILSLLEKFYRPLNGSIRIDGTDITKTADTRFRDDIALVPQSSMLFDDTVEANIRLGSRPDSEDATRFQIESACRKANIHDVISSLPEGYRTRCGMNGSQFSGGQRQRLAIARALIRGPRLLLLDEPTSALDAESERRWQETLETIASGVTVLVIAHRLHTIRRADIIFLIDGGRCIDRGTHEELFQRSESYRANVLHQTLDQ